MTRAIFILLSIILSILWTSGVIYVYADIPDSEYEALRALYEATGGSHWSKSDNWFVGELSPQNPWHGIECNRKYTTILRIKLDHNKLRGKLPYKLSKLSNLETLVLNNNELESGSDALGIFSKLNILNLSNNHFKGAPPSWIGRLENLTELDLSNNRLTGPIPSWIRKLKNLKRLDLSYNELDGRIPSWIGELGNLEEILLDGNKLTGPIPAELGHLWKLRALRIGHNRLAGKIPNAVGKLPNLTDNKSNFKWNALYTKNSSVKAFLENKQEGGDWERTQTIAPGSISARPLSRTSIKVSWESIDYKTDSGGYQVFYSTRSSAPYDEFKLGGTVENKRITGVTVNGLKPSSTYYFVLRTWTNGHGSNRNSVESGFSDKVSAATLGTTISGGVKTTEGRGISGVKLTASEEGGSTITNIDGNYNLSVTPGWSGTITPSEKGYDFIPPFKEYSKVNNDLEGQDFRAEANTVISGKIINSKGKGIPGVILSFSHREGKESTIEKTDSGGNYKHTVTYSWQGTVTPNKTGYRFVPPNREYKRGVTGEEIQDYRALNPEVSGRVKNRRGRGIPGVTLTFFGRDETSRGTYNTDKNGKYCIAIPENWSGSVTPARKGYIFYPGKRNYKKITIDTVKIAGDYKAELDPKFFISIIGNYMVPTEKSFEDIYGSALFNPEIKIGYRFYRGFYGWGGYGISSKNGESLVFKEPAKWEENFISLGPGYYKSISVKFGWKMEAGLVYIRFNEEGLEDKTSTSSIGIRIDGSGVFKISDRFFTEISMGYLFASDRIEKVSKRIKLGGFKTGIGLGFRF